MTPEQIEDRIEGLRPRDVDETATRSAGDLNWLCDLALKGPQAEAMRGEIEAWKLRVVSLGSQCLDMREAIRRAVEKFERYKQEGMYLLPLDEIRADLEQALNERKET